MGGSYTGFSLGDSAVSDVTVETDADGYVQSVTVVSDSQNGSCGYQERMTVYYALRPRMPNGAGCMPTT